MSQQGGQTHAPNNVAICCAEMLRLAGALIRQAHHFISSLNVNGTRQHLTNLVVDTLPRRNVRIRIETAVACFEDATPK